MQLWRAAVLAASMAVAGSGCARAAEGARSPEPQHRLHWRREWRPFQLGDYLWTGGALGGYLYLQFGLAPAKEAHWRGPILFDDAARRSLAAESRDERVRWAVMSDWGFVIDSAAPWITSAVVPLIDRFNWRVAWQLELMNAQSFAFTGLVSRMGHVFVGRERPNTEICAGANRASVVCFGGENASFPSGHAAGAFTGASLSCVHHLELGIFGHPAADVSWCVALLGLATFTAIARNVGEFHYVSDTLAGATLGVASGVGIPLLFHYGVWPGSLFGRSYALMPSKDGFGLQLVGLL